MSDGDPDSVGAGRRRAVRCNDVSRRPRASGSHRPVLPPMGGESKARRLRDRAERRGGVDCRSSGVTSRRSVASSALGAGGNTYLPGIVSAMARARFEPGGRQRRRELLAQTPTVLTEALQRIVGPEDLADPWPSHRQSAPVWKAAGQRRYVHRAVGALWRVTPAKCSTYGATATCPTAPAPVLVYIPGGAWIFGRRELQGHALMAHLVRRGWVCLSIRVPNQPAASLAAADD